VLNNNNIKSRHKIISRWNSAELAPRLLRSRGENYR